MPEIVEEDPPKEETSMDVDIVNECYNHTVAFKDIGLVWYALSKIFLMHLTATPAILSIISHSRANLIVCFRVHAGVINPM